jgi:hypothetical protein
MHGTHHPRRSLRRSTRARTIPERLINLRLSRIAPNLRIDGRLLKSFSLKKLD